MYDTPDEPPMGKLAAYTAAKRQEPIPPTTNDSNLDRPYSPSRSEHQHTVDVTTEDTEQVRLIGDDIAEDTEQARSIVDDTEEGGFVKILVPLVQIKGNQLLNVFRRIQNKLD
ncbi:hypothetical protein PPTG_18104 [Phytophthora nicotianae INRA-310]|uniref:Uncharacterized protein n=1 Tax=Phytophthora nicotianae (strain INRA-310) TaxID=761204 RepID=W2PHT5_PHYN3|nr:hypothetical protein PPTG_18104 [Phytophthora nicotianae INRA-310]ETN00422.1 hypothetical protein PPTG_18104 [Phytophthora nicotianae INRA-310]